MITFYDDGYGVWMIPYPMKTWCQQHPRDIKQEFRYTWNRISHLPTGVKLSAGEFAMVETTVEEFNNWHERQVIEERRSRLNMEISATIKSFSN